MSCEPSKLERRCLIRDNDPRMPNRTLKITGFGLRHFNSYTTFATCVSVHDQAAKPREYRINIQRIHTDGKERKSGFSLLPSPPSVGRAD